MTLFKNLALVTASTPEGPYENLLFTNDSKFLSLERKNSEYVEKNFGITTHHWNQMKRELADAMKVQEASVWMQDGHKVIMKTVSKIQKGELLTEQEWKVAQAISSTLLAVAVTVEPTLASDDPEVLLQNLQTMIGMVNETAAPATQEQGEAKEEPAQQEIPGGKAEVTVILPEEKVLVPKGGLMALAEHTGVALDLLEKAEQARKLADSISAGALHILRNVKAAVEGELAANTANPGQAPALAEKVETTEPAAAE